MIRSASRFALGAGLLAALLGACTNAESVASPQRLATTSHSLVSVPSSTPGPMTTRYVAGYCADVTNASQDPGSPLTIWTCAGPSAPSQQFSWQPNGELRIYGTMCVEAAYGRGRDGKTAVVQTCDGGADQQWHYTAAGEIRDATDNCLAIKGQALRGSRLLMRSCDGSTAQQWDVPMTTVEVADGSPDTTTSTPNDTTPTQPADTTPSDPPPVSSPVVVGAPSTGVAELPRAVPDVQVPAVTGASIRVAAGQNLQTALDNARPGDEIVLDAGATYVGNFTLRAKSGDGWITIRSSAALPAQGTRVTPGSAAGFAKILTPNIMPVFNTEQGVHHVRLAGLEIGATPDVSRVYSLVTLGDASPAQLSLTQVPHHLMLDRVYVHGNSNLDVRRCVALNSAWTAIVDSWLSECHSNDGDSQAVWGSNGPGPYLIQNNRLEGAGENIMFGGADSRSSELMPSDITIRRNHIVKPMSWLGAWVAKNLLELKVGKRVLLEGNVFENSWVNGQTGFAFVLWTVNQEGGAPWSQTADVTVQYNVIKHAANGFQLSDIYGGNGGQPMARVTIQHNLITDIGQDAALGPGGARLFQVNGSISDLTLAHNTASSDGPWVYFVTQPITPLPRMILADNVAFYSQIALRSDYNNGSLAWDSYAGTSGGTMRGNVAAAAVGGLPPENSAPVGTLFDATPAMGFIDAYSGNYRLGSSSPYRGKATDGTDPGANFDAIDSRVRGVVVQ